MLLSPWQHPLMVKVSFLTENNSSDREHHRENLKHGTSLPGSAVSSMLSTPVLNWTVVLREGKAFKWIKKWFASGSAGVMTNWGLFRVKMVNLKLSLDSLISQSILKLTNPVRISDLLNFFHLFWYPVKDKHFSSLKWFSCFNTENLLFSCT